MKKTRSLTSSDNPILITRRLTNVERIGNKLPDHTLLFISLLVYYLMGMPQILQVNYEYVP